MNRKSREQGTLPFPRPAATLVLPATCASTPHGRPWPPGTHQPTVPAAAPHLSGKLRYVSSFLATARAPPAAQHTHGALRLHAGSAGRRLGRCLGSGCGPQAGCRPACGLMVKPSHSPTQYKKHAFYTQTHSFARSTPHHAQQGRAGSTLGAHPHAQSAWRGRPAAAAGGAG
jgi:hypothetical protein